MPKKKGTPGGNPNPVQTPEFVAKQFPAAADIPVGVELADKPLCVKLPVELDAIVRSLPNRSEWIRQAIAEKLNRDIPALAVEPAAETKKRRSPTAKSPSS